MSANCQTLRDRFPEFKDQTVYSDEMIEFWGEIANRLLNKCRWGNMLDLAAMLFVAHHLVLEKQAADVAKRGGTPGQIGVLTSKSVGSVSASYDLSRVTFEGAGHWNMTTYGVRFYQLLRMFGAGPIHIGVGFGTGDFQQAWAGPVVMTNPTQTP